MIEGTPVTIHYGNETTQSSNQLAVVALAKSEFSFEATLRVVEHQNETIILGTNCLKSAGVYLDPENNRLVRKAQQNRTTTEKDTMQQNLEGVQSLRARRRKADYHLGWLSSSYRRGDNEPIVVRVYRRLPKEQEAINQKWAQCSRKMWSDLAQARESLQLF